MGSIGYCWRSHIRGNADEYKEHSLTSQKELEAESVAYCITQYFGVAEDQKRSFAYISSWNRESDQALEQFKSSMSVIAKTVKVIIEGIESAERLFEKVSQ